MEEIKLRILVKFNLMTMREGTVNVESLMEPSKNGRLTMLEDLTMIITKVL